MHRYDTTDFRSLDEVLQAYFRTAGARLVRIMVGMAGPRDDDTGEIAFTNLDWPSFSPQEASKRYGIAVETANDMVVTMGGILAETGIDLLPLKSGTPTTVGTKLVVTLSTGIGTGTAAWDARTRRYVIASGEGGHIGFQPKNKLEHDYIDYLHAKYPHASAELAVSGKHGLDNLIGHMLEATKTPQLADAIDQARTADRPVGAVLLEYATEGKVQDRTAARDILQLMGGILGSTLRDLAVTCKTTGGIYLTGSVAMGLGEHFTQETDFCKRFVQTGAVHDSWLAKVPIYLATDPHVAVKGALTLAKAM